MHYEVLNRHLFVPLQLVSGHINVASIVWRSVSVSGSHDLSCLHSCSIYSESCVIEQSIRRPLDAMHCTVDVRLGGKIAFFYHFLEQCQICRFSPHSSSLPSFLPFASSSHPPTHLNTSVLRLCHDDVSFNVYVSQAEVKPGCVLRQSNWQVQHSSSVLSLVEGHLHKEVNEETVLETLCELLSYVVH